MKKFLLLGIAALLFSSPAFAAYTATANIANGASLSGAVALTAYSQNGGLHPTAIVMPAAWTAAAITLQGSIDGCQTFQNIFLQAGTEYTVTSPAASEYMVLNPNDLVGINCLKVRSGTSASPVNQGAARAILVVLN